MNKPTVLAILGAFERVVKPYCDAKCERPKDNAEFISLQTWFLCEIEPLMNAHRAEETSRKVAIAELFATLVESVDDAAFDFPSEQKWREFHGKFFLNVQPWLDRLKS